MGRNPATRSTRFPFVVQHLVTVRGRQVWGDVKNALDLESGISYVKAQWRSPKENRSWRIRSGRRIVWINECPCDQGDGEGCFVHGFGAP